MVVTGILARGREHPHIMYIYIYYRYYHYFPRLPVLVAPADQHLFLTASPCRLHCRIYRQGIKSHHALPLWRSYGWHKVLPFWTMWVDVGSCGAVEKYCNFQVEIEFSIVFFVGFLLYEKKIFGWGENCFLIDLCWSAVNINVNTQQWDPLKQMASADWDEWCLEEAPEGLF